MTPKEMHFAIKRSGAFHTTKGWLVDISRNHPYVSVEGPDGSPSYWFEGQEALDLIKEADTCAETFDCKPHECILWYSESW